MRLRAIRRGREWTREDVAALARSHGLRWTHNTVKNIEAGTRGLAEELLALLLLFGVSAAEYFGDGSPPLALTPLRAVEPSELAQILAGSIRRDADVTPATVTARVSFPGIAVVSTSGEVVRLADQKAARVLGVTVAAIEDTAAQIWGRSLTAERDRRLEERVGERQVTPRSRQALRGHITRAARGAP